MGKLSQAISEGDGISILVQADDAETAGAAERQGADGLVTGAGVEAVRATSQLPLLHLGGLAEANGAAAADGVVVAVDPAVWDAGHALGLECVVRVSHAEELERALEELDPEIFLLSPRPEEDEDVLEALGLLHDVPAGKLAIAELHDANEHDVAGSSARAWTPCSSPRETSRRSCRPSRRTSDHLAPYATTPPAAIQDTGTACRSRTASSSATSTTSFAVDGAMRPSCPRPRARPPSGRAVARKRSRRSASAALVWPSTVTRVSYPVAFVISSATTCPMPPRRA